jgi:hypothetical protein
MRRVPTALVVLVCCAVGACGGGGGGAPTVRVDPTRFVAGVDHSFFPILPGWTWVYEGEDDGLPLREEMRSLADRRSILGVACTALEERTFVDGALVGVSTEWFAQDDEGNVWKFGEESFESDGVGLVPADDSWIANPSGPGPWMAFAAHPRVGDRYVGHGPGGPDVHEVTALDATADVPAGAFVGCMQVVENPDDPEDSDVILYAPGVGRVSETNPSGRAVLVAVGPS